LGEEFFVDMPAGLTSEDWDWDVTGFSGSCE